MLGKHAYVRKMLIKTSLEFHLTPVRLKKTKATDADENVGDRQASSLLAGCRLVRPLWKMMGWQLHAFKKTDSP